MSNLDNTSIEIGRFKQLVDDLQSFMSEIATKAEEMCIKIVELENEAQSLRYFYEQIMMMHSCDDCKGADACRYKPLGGYNNRFNCPLWRGDDVNDGK